MFIGEDGNSIDLLRREVTKNGANRYVTWLIDILFTPVEFVSISAQNVPNDNRYQLMKGRSNFNSTVGFDSFFSRCCSQ